MMQQRKGRTGKKGSLPGVWGFGKQIRIYGLGAMKGLLEAGKIGGTIQY